VDEEFPARGKPSEGLEIGTALASSMRKPTGGVRCRTNLIRDRDRARRIADRRVSVRARVRVKDRARIRARRSAASPVSPKSSP